MKNFPIQSSLFLLHLLHPVLSVTVLLFCQVMPALLTTSRDQIDSLAERHLLCCNPSMVWHATGLPESQI